MRLSLTCACGVVDRTQRLATGLIKPVDIDLTWVHGKTMSQIFYRMLVNEEFDVSELSMSNYLTEISRPNPRFIAIPVFPSRTFRHSCIFVRSDSNIRCPEDLRGKRIGAPEYSMTALLWLRGLLKHEYGVNPEEMQWFVGGLNAPAGDDTEKRGRIEISLPKEINITHIPNDACLNDLLLDGKLDAILTARSPKAFNRGDQWVKRLFENYREEEIKYFKKTGLFPIMHTVVIKRDIYERYPWVARNLYDAFLESKNNALEALFEQGHLQASLPWLRDEAEMTKEIMGEDFWPYGIKKNRAIVETMVRYAYEQHLISRRDLRLEDIFAHETLDT